MCHDLRAWTSWSQQPVAASVIILSVWAEGNYHSAAAELRDWVEVSKCKTIHTSSTKQHINTQGLLHPCETSSSKSLLSSSKNQTGLCFVSSNRWKSGGGGGLKAPTELPLLISVSGTPLPAHSAGQTLPNPAGTHRQTVFTSQHGPAHPSALLGRSSRHFLCREDLT